MCCGQMERDLCRYNQASRHSKSPNCLETQLWNLLLFGGEQFLRESFNHSSVPPHLKTPAFLYLLSDEVVFESFVSMFGLKIDVQSSLTLLLELSWI